MKEPWAHEFESAHGGWVTRMTDAGKLGFGFALAIALLLLSPLLGRAEGACSGEADCSPTQFCARSQGSCAGEGICSERPEACIEIYDPVCGCDGETYSNGCHAAMAGVGVAHVGECSYENDCPGGASENPCSESEYCRLGAGQCSVQQLGTCEPRPEICTEQWDPVCGCDGDTYGNACQASAAGINIDYAGACSSAFQCVDDDTEPHCDAGQYCFVGIGQCDVQAAGTCETTPGVCTYEYFPVCGCDGVTYSNICHAASAGMNVDHLGTCSSANACTPETESEVCYLGEYCAVETGPCSDEVAGHCEPMVQACTMDLNPVCGCDGKTYTNRCTAAAEGVNVDSIGECGQTAVSVPGIASWAPGLALGVALLGASGWALRTGRHFRHRH